MALPARPAQACPLARVATTAIGKTLGPVRGRLRPVRGPATRMRTVGPGADTDAVDSCTLKRPFAKWIPFPGRTRPPAVTGGAHRYISV